MKITSIYIKNYKSINEVNLVLSDKVNIFIGENSVGKSNIFAAIDWVLGPNYPSFNNFAKEDFYRGDTSAHVTIRIHFDDGHYLELTNLWRDRYGNSKSGLNLDGSLYVSDDVRQKYISALIGPERKVADNPASNRWTLLGRLLRDINAKFMRETIRDDVHGEIEKSELFKKEMERIRNEILFSVTDDEGNNLMQQFISILGVETAKQLNKTPDEFNVDLNMYDPWNFYRTLQIMVHEAETGMTFRASELGMGVQASITIAILKAYSRMKLKNQTPIMIDEPELYLHPQGRRNFYKIIRDLAENGTQVLLTTHSSEFIDLNHFDEIFVVRKSIEKGTYIRSANPRLFVDDFKARYGRETTETDIMERYRNAFENTGDSQKSSEAMFARKVILVEGESEVLILPYLFSLYGYDEISEGITIVRCGGKSEIDRYYRLYSEFGIPCYIIFDGDYQNVGKEDEAATINKNKGILSLFGVNENFPDGIVHENHLGFKYRLEENLGINDIGNAKALALYRRVKKEITKEEQVPLWVKEVIIAVENLPVEATSVLRELPSKHFNIFDF